MIAEAPSGGSGDSQPCWAQSTRSAGQQRQRAAARALAEQHAQRRGVEHHQVGQAAGDLAGQPALLGLLGQRGAGGVDHGDQRQPQLGGQPHAAPRGPQRAGAERRLRGLAAPVLAEHDRRRAAEPGQREEQPGVALALAGAVQRHHVRRARAGAAAARPAGRAAGTG